MDKSFYAKFPCCFRNALASGEVSFTTDPVTDFSQFEAFRGIFRAQESSFEDINRLDFLSQAEMGRLYNPRFGQKESFYSCSVFLKFEECAKALVFPNEKNDRKIAVGPIDSENGCIRVRELDGHVDWWIYDSPKPFWESYKIV